MDSREITLWLDERWVAALEKQLKGKTLTEHLEKYLDEMTRQLPKQVYEQISSEIREEDLRRQEEWEASRRFSVLRVKENGIAQYLETNSAMEFLDMAKVLRNYLRNGEKQGFGSDWKPISPDEFKTYAAERMDNTGRIAGAFDIDLDNGKIAALNIMDGWQVFRIKDVSTAAYHAMRRSGIDWDRRFEIFLDKLYGKQLSSMDAEKPEKLLCGERPLCAEDIRFAESIEQIENRLNFYMEVRFDADAVFGTHVWTDGNYDYLNVYASYDLEKDEVCDTLDVVLVRDDQNREYKYQLTAEEKAAFRQKMDIYVWELWETDLAECVVQYHAENEREQTAPEGMLTQGGIT